MKRAVDELNAEQQQQGKEARWCFPRDKEVAPVLVPARLIAKHEQPPVDPILAAAREAVARWLNGKKSHLLADQVREGGGDDRLDVETCMAAITLYLEREASK